jgi:pyrroline-5-carboxylate reductase
MHTIRLGYMGAGQMATALAGGAVRSGIVQSERIWAYDPSDTAWSTFANSVPGAHRAVSPEELAHNTDVLVLAVKPQHASEACQALHGHVQGKLVLSVVAGLSLNRLRRWLDTDRLVRVMPNTPCLIGRGASAYCSTSEVSEESLQWVHQFLTAVGWTTRVPESLLDAVTGLSGSGPAYVAVFLEALADGGVRAGLPRTTAYQLALHTVLGTAELLRQTNRHPAEVKDQVASPAGTTIAGLLALEEHAFRAAVINAVDRARQRAAELGAALEAG